MNKRIVFALLGLAMLISVFFHFFRIDQLPPCLNADEAAFGYNAYSVAKTGRDEYGKLLPLRFKSFEDYKLPVYSYFSAPFMWLFGLNDFSTRVLNIIIGIAFIPLFYFVIKELYDNEKAALTGAFLLSLSPWIYILSRHAHEGVSCAFFVLSALLFLMRFIKKLRVSDFLLINIFVFLAAFSYHSGRMFLIFFALVEIYFLYKNRMKITKKNLLITAAVAIFTLVFPFIIDSFYGVNRVANLFYLRNAGFHLRLAEYLIEHAMPWFHNQLTESVRDISFRYLSQISTEYFLIWGDRNWRFGFQNIGLITPVEYIFFFIGLYYYFKNKYKYRFLMFFLFLISPLPNAFTWQDASIIRTYFTIFPLLVITTYGVYNLFCSLKRKNVRVLVFGVIFLIYLFFVGNSWDVYLLHYPKRAVITRAWQCGYKELVSYVKENYNKYDRFVITDRHGQPYIYFLYYLNYDPAKYQKQAKISAPDGYGFGQVERFDKFYFKFNYDPKAKKTVFVGYPEEFKGLPINPYEIKKIKIRTEEIFWIYEQ